MPLKIYNKRLHKRPKKVAHGHFVYGAQVYDSSCEYCIGVDKPKKTPKELAEKKRLQDVYRQEWYRTHP